MTIASDFVAGFRQQLKQIGGSITYVSISFGSGATGTGTNTPTTLNAIISQYRKQFESGNGAVRQTDRRIQFLAADLAQEPQVGDKVTIGAQSYEVLNVIPKIFGPTVVTYSCQVRT